MAIELTYPELTDNFEKDVEIMTEICSILHSRPCPVEYTEFFKERCGEFAQIYDYDEEALPQMFYDAMASRNRDGLLIFDGCAFDFD